MMNERNDPHEQNDDAQNDDAQNDDAQNGESFTWGDGISITIQPDGLRASLELLLDFATHYTQDDLERYLSDQKIVTGINVDAVRSIIQENMFNEPVVVAKGIEPVHGKDGEIDWKVDIGVLDGAKLIEHQGKVDWKEQHHVLQVTEGQLVAELIPPQQGKPGKTVHGKDIPANDGKEGKLPAGKNFRVSEDGQQMFAEIDGAVSRNGDQYTISQTFEVRGDVSLESGNVDYHGTVVINGGVLAGFTVKSGQDIHVNGLVEAAFLDAKGSIFINGGVQGDQKAKIIAGEDITVKYVNNATLHAKGNIIVHSSISQSVVQSHDRVIVEGPKGTIVGGKVFAENEIAADIYGAELGTKTHIVLGADLSEYAVQIRNHEKKYKTVAENAQKLEQALAQLNRLKEAGKISPQHEEMQLKLLRANMQQKGQVKSLNETINSMREELAGNRKKQKGIIVRDTAWQGTTMQILAQTHAIQKKATKVIYAMPRDEIQEFGYKITDGKEVAEKKIIIR